MHKSTNIRAVEASDLKQLKEILDQTELFPSEILEQMIDPFFSNPDSHDLWFTYCHKGMPVAFAFCQPEIITEGTWNVMAIAVRPSTQGQGIGELLMTYIENLLRNKSQRILIVETSGLPEFELTRKFYEKIGYTLEAKIRDFYEQGDDKIVYWKSLNQ